jgi:hypothetical protein
MFCLLTSTENRSSKLWEFFSRTVLACKIQSRALSSRSFRRVEQRILLDEGMQFKVMSQDHIYLEQYGAGSTKQVLVITMQGAVQCLFVFVGFSTFNSDSSRTKRDHNNPQKKLYGLSRQRWCCAKFKFARWDLSTTNCHRNFDFFLIFFQCISFNLCALRSLAVWRREVSTTRTRGHTSPVISTAVRSFSTVV